MKLFGTLRELVAAVFRKDGHEITLRPNQTSSLYTTNRAVSLPQVDNDVVLTASGYIANADIAAAAGIVDSKLATISTAGKVSNSATTATDANTASAIVARDASGNFSAGTITASLSGNASTATTATSFSGSLSGEVTGTQSATVVASGVIDNDNISATAGIVDTKLATISTAGKVSNSATTATSANTASAIVARDGSGNFSAGTVSASGVNVSGLTVSRAVVTDGSKNLASLEYTTAATGSTLVSRDVAGSTSVNTLTAANIDVTGLATMDKAYIDGSSGQGFIEFEGQTVGDVPAPTTGEARLFAGTDGKIYVRKAGSSQAEELGAGGSGEINLVDNSSDAGNWGVVNATATTNTTAANNPLSGTIDTSIAIASSTSGGYARYRFSMPSALKQRKLKLEWYQIASSLTSGAYKVEVWTNASSDYSGAYTELSLSTDSSGTSNIPNLNGKYSTTFDTNGSDYYEIRVVRTAASAATIYIANVVCGPGIQPQGAVVQYLGQLSFTPNNFGTVATTRYESWRVGNKLRVVARWTNGGTLGGSAASLSLPSGYTLDSTQFPTSTQSVGNYIAVRTTAGTLVTGAVFYDGSDTTKLYFAANSGAVSGALTKDTGVIVGYANGAMDITFEVPIAEWAGSGTVQLAQNDVEYAWNSSTSTTADTTSFGYGPSGVAFTAMAPTGLNTIEKRVRFQTPVQDTDALILEVYNGGGWQGAIDAFGGYSVDSTNIAYGQIVRRVSGSSTDVSVLFTSQSSGRSNWSSFASAGWRWRVRKSSAGAAVGFGIVSPGVSAGLVSASGLPGNTTGNAIASGYVGEYKESAGLFTTPASGQRGDVATLTLSAGIWDVQGSVQQFRNGATYGTTLWVISIITAAGNSSTGEVPGVNQQTWYNSFGSTPETLNILTPVIRVISDGTNLTIAGITTAGQTIRLKYYPSTYSVATPTVNGLFRATRIA